MKITTIGGKDYRLPSALNDFQREIYIHLIDWKWAHITHEPGLDGGIFYDAILPEAYADQFPTIYPPIKDALRAHQQNLPFRIHKYFNHMASSQAANLNLFLPILYHPSVDAILSSLKPDFAHLATAELDHGYRIEFWDQWNEPYGSLGDKTNVSGTDADIAIAYYNHQNVLCLWLIEHKLTEKEFTECGGYRSKGRQPGHDCTRSFGEILAAKHICYYHDVLEFAYWTITDNNQSFFPNHSGFSQCPFQSGMNQLWRNQLLALSIEQDGRQPYRQVSFSVVKHPRNIALDRTLSSYQELIAHNPRFSVFTSADAIAAANQFGDESLKPWITWYRILYDI